MRPRSPARTLSACAAVLGGATLAALVAAASWPATAVAFTLTGQSLPLSQRDFRVFNNFLDPTANDNTFPHPNFPGVSGAAMAICKAHAEWGSGPRAGNGLGDGLADNAELGSGGANFDNTWQGLAAAHGGDNDNIHGALVLGSVAILALTQTPVTDGWKTWFNETVVWDDGPGAPVAGAMDLQGIATAQVGFTLGLGLSTEPGATMKASMISGNGTHARSLEADDIAGIQAIYGVAAAGKPRITALAGTLDTGSTLIISGTGFAATGNEVWFTQPGGDGTPLKVTGVASTGGGTQLALTIPAGVSAGEVLVLASGTGGAALSNAFPIDIDAPPGAFQLTGPGLAGAGDTVPQLTGAGDLSPGGAGFQIFMQLVKSSASGALFVSLAEANQPFKGGVFDPLPILLQVPLTVGADGRLVLPAAIPAGPLSGLELVTQAWFADAAAVQGVSATNGLRLVIE
jgi:hypothetical protein